MTPDVYQFVREIVHWRPKRQYVIDLGGRNVNGTCRDLFPKDCRYVSVDLVDGVGVDVVADAAEYTPRGLPDTILCLEMLEHTARAADVIKNAHSILGADGILIVTVPIDPYEPHSAIDGGPLRDGEYYGNIELTDMMQWLQCFEYYTCRIDSVKHRLYIEARK